MSTEQGPGATEQTLNTSNLTPRPPIGCVECRTRGLQCDSDPETLRQACSSCVRNGYICSRLMAGVNATRPARTTPRKGVEKRRIQTACNWCRKQKIRCSGDTPCGACIIRNQHCVYTAVHRQHTGDGDDSILQNDWHSGLPRYDVPGQDVMDVTPSTNLQPDQIYQAPAPIIRQGPLPIAAGKTQPDIHLGLDKNVVGEYVGTFFRFVYPVACMSFLHQATFLRQWHTGTVNLSLLKIVCGCALRVFSISQTDNDRADEWMREAELDALQNLGDLSIPRLQALTLLAFYEFTYRVYSKKALMLLGLAARLAFARRLNYEVETLSIVERESRRRLMWAIFVLDKFCSGGLVELTLCPPEHMEIRLPCNEKSFGFGTRCETQLLNTQLNTGNNSGNSEKTMDEFAYTVRVLDLLRNKVHRLTRRIISSDEGLFSSAQEIQSLDAEIDLIEQQLPADLKWTKTNLQQRIYSPNLSSFVMLHTWRLQCKCDLYRLTVPGGKHCVSDIALANTAFDYAQSLRLKCLDNAIDLTKLWAEVLDFGLEKPVYDPAIAGCAHQCAQILATIPDQSRTMTTGQESRMAAILVCQLLLEPIKEIFPKAKILCDQICQIRADFNTSQSQDLSATMPTTSMNRDDLAMGMQTNNEEQVRHLLNQFSG